MQLEATAKREVESLTSSSTEKFLEGLAEKFGTAVRAATIFGQPVERSGVTVIPVAKARWGFGGGTGRNREQDGTGGGGGAQVSPVGFIELKDGAAEFRRIQTLSLPQVILASLASLLLFRGVSRWKRQRAAAP